MNKYLLMILSICVYTSCINTKRNTDNIITQHISLKGKEYDKLMLYITLDNDTTIIINGISDDKSNWAFSYTDSIYERHRYMSLSVPTQYDTLVHSVGIHITNNTDTFKLGSFTIDKYPEPLHLSLVQSDTLYKVIYYRFKDAISDGFVVTNKNLDNELFVMGENFGYSLFYEMEDGLSYQDCIDKYANIAKKYPESHYIISSLAENVTNYKSNEDIRRIYNQFSDKNKESYYGKKLNSFLNLNRFENSLLPAWNTSQKEYILQDTTKYLLVVFSASWCGPCHKQIPLLKEIYKDLGRNLDIVYISMDEHDTIDRWKELMLKENIPWRSVMASSDLKNIRVKYYAYAIPHTLLVYPDGRTEIFDIRLENNKEKLYQIVGN